MSALSGIRVVTMALNVPGPLTAAYLRDEGAQITKIEPPTGDPLAEFCAPLYRAFHENVGVEQVDLKAERGRARIGELLAAADLFLASQRPAALSRLGLDHATLVAHPPTAHLRWLNLVGEIDRPEIAGHDLTYLARAGLLGREMPRTLVADVLGATRAFAAALLLLRQPPGSQVTIGLFDSLAPLVALRVHGLTAPGGLLGGRVPGYRIYETREGHVAIAALEPHFRTRLYARLALADDSDLTEILKTRTAVEWEAWAIEQDLPISQLRI